MSTYSFWDDQRLLVRENLHREVGTPQLLSDTIYREGYVSGACCQLWKQAEDSWYLFYQSFLWNIGNREVIRVAHSTDGLHFSPCTWAAKEAGIENPYYPDQILPGWDAELAAVIDTGISPGRLRMLVSAYEYEKVGVQCKIYASDDGIHWSDTGDYWHQFGTEPLASVFYSSYQKEYVLLCRPAWGTRRVSISLTKDLKHFTVPQPLLQADALDKPLAETYGMFGFPYKDMYIGILHLYNTIPSDTWKFMGGKMEGQLAYSFDSVHWLRSLRTPLMKNDPPFGGMIFTSAMRNDQDGSILLYCSGTDLEHGHFAEGNPQIGVFRLREDDFIHLRAVGEGRLRTRETLLRKHFDINLCCKYATCALYSPDGKPLDGFSHTDCIPFSGDCTHWTPRFHQDIESLAGKVVTIEIKLVDGNIYAINGDFVKMMNCEAWRYEKDGTLPAYCNP